MSPDVAARPNGAPPRPLADLAVSLTVGAFALRPPEGGERAAGEGGGEVGEGVPLR